MNQHSNMYSGQVQQHGQSSYYSNTQSPNSGMQQVTYIQTLKELILFYQSSNSQIRVVLIVVESIHVFVYYLPFCCLNLSPGDSPSAQFPVVSAKLWLRWRSASPGTASHSSPGPAPHHQSTAPSLPAIQRHHGPQPQHDAASHQQGTVVCMHGSLTHTHTHTEAGFNF